MKVPLLTSSSLDRLDSELLIQGQQAAKEGSDSAPMCQGRTMEGLTSSPDNVLDFQGLDADAEQPMPVPTG